jgi:diaminopimelate decarboxylase
MIVATKILDYINSKCEGEFDAFYIYDTQKIRAHCKSFQNITYKNKAIHFASMANVNHQFLQIVKEEKLNVFVNSILHLQSVYKAGFRGNKIIFTSSALNKKTMKQAENYGVQLNLDSPNQLTQWFELFPNKPVGIRCNIGEKVPPFSSHAGSFIGKESRLGFTLQEIDEIGDKSKIKGLHLYAGTDIFDIDYFIACYKELIAVAENFDNLEYINFGGGFGVSENGNEQFDMAQYNTRVTELMNQVSLKKNKSLKLILEPGRIIGGEAGYFVCHVSDIKNRDKKQLIGVNASTVQFSRPLLYAEIANHPVMIIRDGVQLHLAEKKPTLVYGCSTYSRDIFANKTELPELKIGDVVVFGNAGSYCASSHMQFLGFQKPKEYFV